MKKKLQSQLDRANKMYAQLVEMGEEMQDYDSNSVAFDICEAGATMQQVVEHLSNAVKRLDNTL